MARPLTAHGETALEDANKVLVAIEPAVARWDLTVPTQGRAIFEQMRGMLSGSQQIFSTWILDGQGMSRPDTWAYPSKPIDGAQRPYFKAHNVTAGAGAAPDRASGTLYGKRRAALRTYRRPSGAPSETRFTIASEAGLSSETLKCSNFD